MKLPGRAGLALATIVALFAVPLLRPSRIEPAPWSPPARPAPRARWTENRELRQARRMAEGRVHGPEDVAFDAGGRLYTGSADGKILRVGIIDESVEELAATGGRPLGLMFDKTGRLIVCDALMGLLAVDGQGRVTRLATEAEGVPFRFTNNLDIGSDGSVYFTDASSRFGPGEYLYDLLEARPHGRLLRYAADRGTVTVLVRDLCFANGVSLARDESYVLVAETYRYRVLRHWLKGARAGSTEVFLDNLPGFPDNLSRDENGSFWLALFTVRNDLVDALHPHPLAKRLLAGLPRFLWPRPAAYGLVVNLTGAGQVLRSLHDPGGERFKQVTTAREHQGVLYLGTLEDDWLGRYRLPRPFVPIYRGP